MTQAATTARRVIHPKTGKNALWALGRGTRRFVAWYGPWIAAKDKAHLIDEKASAKNKEQHEAVCRRRMALAGSASAVALFTVLVGAVMVGPQVPVLFAVSVLVSLAGLGRKDPIVVPLEAVPHKVEITQTNIQKAVASATIGLKTTDWERVRVLGAGVAWDKDRRWWSARVELPDTIPGKAVQDAKGLPSGLGIGKSQLIVKVDTLNDGVVTLQGCIDDPWARPSSVSPLASAAQWNVWDPTPIADDARGSQITISLLFTGFLVGAIPRIGKTYVARLLMLAAALDPYTRLYVYDLKGGLDWRMFAPIAQSCGFGHTDAVIAALLRDLEAILVEIDRRSEVIAGLDVERCPEGQVTQALAHDPALGLEPIFVSVDEVQWALSHRLYGKKIVDALENIVKGGQFVAVQVILATQRPDSQSVPTRVRDVLATRIALKCMTRQSSETVLGTQAYQEGWDAAALPSTKGVAIMYGADDTSSVHEPMIVRTHKVDVPVAQEICQRAHTLRIALSRLPGQREPENTEQYASSSFADYVKRAAGSKGYVMSADLLAYVNANAEHLSDGVPLTYNTLSKTMQRNGFGTPVKIREQENKMGYRVTA